MSCRRRPAGRQSFGSCLIIGGTGALGVAAAIWLAQSGCTALCLASRRGRLSKALSAGLHATARASVTFTVTMCEAGAVDDCGALTPGVPVCVQLLS